MVNYDHHLHIFVELEFPILYTKIQPQNLLGSGDEMFKACLIYMDMTAILFKVVEPYQQIVNILATDDPM